MREFEKPVENIGGLYVYDPRYHDDRITENTRANCVINLKEFVEWASQPENNVNGYIFFDFKESRTGNKRIYAVRNEWRYKNGMSPIASARYSKENKDLEKLKHNFKLPE